MSEYHLVVPRNTVYLHTEDSVLYPLADRYAVLREEPENKYPAKKKSPICTPASSHQRPPCPIHDSRIIRLIRHTLGPVGHPSKEYYVLVLVVHMYLEKDKIWEFCKFHTFELTAVIYVSHMVEGSMSCQGTTT